MPRMERVGENNHSEKNACTCMCIYAHTGCPAESVNLDLSLRRSCANGIHFQATQRFGSRHSPRGLALQQAGNKAQAAPAAVELPAAFRALCLPLQQGLAAANAGRKEPVENSRMDLSFRSMAMTVSCHRTVPSSSWLKTERALSHNKPLGHHPVVTSAKCWLNMRSCEALHLETGCFPRITNACLLD